MINDEWLDNLWVHTTDGTTFTGQQHRELAKLIYARFGHSLRAAASAWRALLQNDCSEREFARIAGLEHEEE